MPVSLIITVYKDYQTLERVLESVCQQSIIPAQIIIAHDAIDRTIRETLDKFSSSLSITHIDQEDTGFNKNRILNKAILLSSHEKLIFKIGRAHV